MMRTKSSKLLAVFAVLFALSLVAAACGGTGGSDGDTITIGSLLPQSGDLESLGVPMTESVEVAGAVVNDAGGVLDSDVEIVATDSATDENQGADAASQLANVDGVPAFVGAAGSGISFAALEVARDAEMTQVSPASTSPDFTTADDGGFFFRTAPSDTLQGKAAAMFADQEGHATAVTIALNNPYGQGFAEVFKVNFEALGGTVADEIFYDPQGANFDSEIAQLQESAPDMMMLVGYPDTGSVILRSAYQQGVFDETEILVSEGLADNTLQETVGEAEDGSWIIEGIQGTSPKATGPAYDFFSQQFQEEVGEDTTGPFDANSYDAAVLIFLAIEQAGEATGPAIADNIVSVSAPPGEEVSEVGEALDLIRSGEEINYQGASGAVDMDDVGDVLSDYDFFVFDEEGLMEPVTTITSQDLME